MIGCTSLIDNRQATDRTTANRLGIGRLVVNCEMFISNSRVYLRGHASQTRGPYSVYQPLADCLCMHVTRYRNFRTRETCGAQTT